MKRNRFIVILVAMAMSMLLVHGALAADEELGELLESIEADRFTVVDDLVNRFGKNKETAEELRATLDSANGTKLAEIVQNADSLEDVSAILAGTEDIFALGDLDKDYVFTPVRPCRIVDTRKGGGGVFFPGQVREFFVYGDTTAQGGANCPSARGEPRGVHINVTAVPQSGQGNFRAYPANVSAPNASLVNYKAGVQNIANAASVKTHFQLGTGGLKIQNRVGSSHLVVDILGYYHDAEPEKIVAAASTGTVEGVIYVGTSIMSPTTLVSKTVTIPTSGSVILIGEASWNNNQSNSLGCSFTENGSRVDYWKWEAGDSEGSLDLRQSHSYMKTVSPGTKTYALKCFRYNGSFADANHRTLTVIFIKEGL